MAVLVSTSLYFTLLHSTWLNHGSTWLYSTMALLDSFLPWLYVTLHDPTFLYFILLASTLLYHGSTSIYFTLHYSTMDIASSLYFIVNITLPVALLHCTLLYISLLWFYLTRLHSTWLYHGSTWFYFTLYGSTIALLNSTLLYTWLYHSWNWLYLTWHFSIMVLLHSTSLFINLPWVYFTLLYSSNFVPRP